MHQLYKDQLQHREQTERGLGGGAVDKLLVGLGEVNLAKPLQSSLSIVLINIQFSSFSHQFLLTTNKTIYIHLYTNNTVQSVYMYFPVFHLEYISDILNAIPQTSYIYINARYQTSYTETKYQLVYSILGTGYLYQTILQGNLSIAIHKIYLDLAMEY